MKLIKAGLARLSPSEVVAKSEYVENEMTGNANFASPSPTLADVSAARTALVAALAAAQSGAHADIAKKNEAVRNLRDLLTKLARYVNSVAGGDVDKAVSSGFELSKRPDPIDKLDAPAELNARYSPYQGRIDLRWVKVRGARMYQVYICSGDPGVASNWRPLDICTKSRFEVLGLESNTFFSFRVAAMGRVGLGPASEVVTAKAA